MADAPDEQEKTEDATPRRLEEAREKGQVAFSTEIMSAATLMTALLAIGFAGAALTQAAGRIVVSGANDVAYLGREQLEATEFASLLRAAAQQVLPPVLMLVLPVAFVAALVGYSQVGGVRLTPKAIAPDPSKISPMAGAKRMVSPRSFVRTGLSALKLVVVGVAVVGANWQGILRMGSLAGADTGPFLAALGILLLRAGITGVIAILFLSVFDFWFQRHQFQRDMRMSKKEVKDEQKSSEGDPLVKARIRQVQREVSSRRMLADVPDATVVVTNPTHFAVALNYDPGLADAPRVVAKGVDEVAETIKRIAREAGVTMFEDPPLARALHRSCEIGSEVPEELFQAVAAVLAYVYRLRGEAPVEA